MLCCCPAMMPVAASCFPVHLQPAAFPPAVTPEHLLLPHPRLLQMPSCQHAAAQCCCGLSLTAPMLLRPCASSSRCCCSTADTPLCALRRYGFVAYRERKHAQAAHAKLQEQPLLLNGSLIPIKATWAQTDVSEAATAAIAAASVTKYTQACQPLVASIPCTMHVSRPASVLLPHQVIGHHLCVEHHEAGCDTHPTPTPHPCPRTAPPQDWDQGFSEAAKAGLRQPSVVKYTTEDVARFPAPGTADFIMAQRFRQLQADYQAAKAALKAQLKQAEQQLLQGVSAHSSATGRSELALRMEACLYCVTGSAA